MPIDNYSTVYSDGTVVVVRAGCLHVVSFNNLLVYLFAA
jgi:hypothetical protein